MTRRNQCQFHPTANLLRLDAEPGQNLWERADMTFPI